MNLIEQQNLLKGLTDESLQAELAQSATGSPPYLVAAELSRRKRQRESYEGEKARRAERSTVLEDLTGGAPGIAPGMPMATSMAPQMPMAPAQQGIAAFADGGLVGNGGLDYAAIGERYAKTLAELPERQDRARALALIMAGANIAGGKSSNALTNIGQGIAPAVEMYGRELNVIDSQEQDLLRSALDLGRVQQGDALQSMRFDWERENAEKNRELDRERLKQPPAGIQTFDEYKNMSPEDRALYRELNPTFNPNALTNDMRIAKEFDDIFQQVERSIPAVEDSLSAMTATPEELNALVEERLKKVKMVTYERIKAAHGAEAAARYARQAGIADGDVLTSGTAAPVNDPLNLGL